MKIKYAEEYSVRQVVEIFKDQKRQNQPWDNEKCNFKSDNDNGWKTELANFK